MRRDPLRRIGTDVFTAARRSIGEKGRAIFCFHQPEDAVQRMVNALTPGTYIRPHSHTGAGQSEVCIALLGAAAVLTFDEAGEVLERCVIRPGSALVGVEIPPGVVHTLIALEPVTTLYEVHQGPYDAATHKRLAGWAPEEGTAAGAAWLEKMR